MWVNLKSGRIVQGGSTITQQIAKNLFLTPERTIRRKIQESMLSLWLERRFTKAQLLAIYLNRVYLGAGTYGVEAAAAKYFGKSARNLGLYESALIAGLLKAPSRFAPTHNPELSERRTAQVLVNMAAAGFLTPDQVENAKHTKPKLKIHKAPPRSTRYFVDWLLLTRHRRPPMANENGRKRETKHRMNLMSVIETYHDEDACREDLVALRWPDGVACPRCGSLEIRNSYTRNQYDCGLCGYQFSVTSGTCSTTPTCRSRSGLSPPT